MKKIITISILFISFFGFGQEIDILYNTTWKLFQFDYNGINYNNSIPTESNLALLDINEQSPDVFSTFIKTNSVNGTIIIDEGNETMNIFDTSVTLLECDDYCDLEGAYLNFFFNDGNPLQFNYNIVVFLNDIEFILSLTDSQGNKAEYFDFVLSQEEFNKNTFSVFPNPTSKSLNWTHNFLNDLKIYNIQGKLVREFQSPNGTIDISDLKAGVYIVEFKNEGQSVVKKFVKK